ncbi:Acetyltransferase (GNAT) family protein [Actinacidiphila alni]|uniref:Acetyltransferase (GNAT) family protein n=1 Tax=Actinacidiphila alni TaxID=380248 RepID=A0A1I2JHA2_9ACTN|nr:GNAT family N-acetyltransferase [Actinacidiphila alni]SFF54222.1 Acetyltransferase (GNAT) family protein [Actinacidiphila alni]
MATSVVRAIQDADIPGTAAALIEVHATDGYPVEGVDQPEEWITPPTVIQAWVAEIDHRIVGHVAIMRPQGEDAVALWQKQTNGAGTEIAVLARLFVIREARGHSVGEELMRAAAAYAQQRGMRLVLDVMTKDTAAIRLYERLGWRPIGKAIHRYGDDQQINAICYVSPATPPVPASDHRA